MVKLTYFISSKIAYLYMLSGALAFAQGVAGYFLLIPFALILLVYGFGWLKFCLITRDATINYYSYKSLSQEIDKIPNKDGFKVKRSSLGLFTLALIGTLLLLILGIDEVNYAINTLRKGIQDPEEINEHFLHLFLFLIFLFFNGCNLYYSLAVYRSIAKKQKN